MGISERKEREKEDLKLRILHAARDLFIEKGIEATSIRNIAERIEYSPTTIYLYYKDKDDLCHALHTEGFGMLRDKMQVLWSVEDPMERLKAMGRIYIQFAEENPELYDLMFIIKAPMNAIEEDDNQWQEGKGAFDILVQTVEQCRQHGHFRDLNTEVVSFVVWSTVHGMASLHIRERCTKVISAENHDQILEKGIDTFTRMLDRMAG